MEWLPYKYFENIEISPNDAKPLLKAPATALFLCSQVSLNAYKDKIRVLVRHHKINWLSKFQTKSVVSLR